MGSAVWEAGSSADDCAWQCDLGTLLEGYGFEEGLESVEDAGFAGAVYGDSFGIDDDTVCLGVVAAKVGEGLGLAVGRPLDLLAALVELDALGHGDDAVVYLGVEAESDGECCQQGEDCVFHNGCLMVFSGLFLRSFVTKVLKKYPNIGRRFFIIYFFCYLCSRLFL